MLTRDVTEGTSPPSAPLAPPRHRWWHASPAGLAGGAASAAPARTPSLIPRDPGPVERGWQRDLADLMGTEGTTTSGWLRAGPATLVVALVLVVVARGRGEQDTARLHQVFAR